MRINESTIRRIIREESGRMMLEKFSTETGLPIDADGVRKVIEGAMPKLASGDGISKQEYWTLYMIVQIALHSGGLIDNAASQLVKNSAEISKHL